MQIDDGRKLGPGYPLGAFPARQRTVIAILIGEIELVNRQWSRNSPNVKTFGNGDLLDVLLSTQASGVDL